MLKPKSIEDVEEGDYEYETWCPRCGKPDFECRCKK